MKTFSQSIKIDDDQTNIAKLNSDFANYISKFQEQNICEIDCVFVNKFHDLEQQSEATVYYTDNTKNSKKGILKKEFFSRGETDALAVANGNQKVIEWSNKHPNVNILNIFQTTGIDQKNLDNACQIKIFYYFDD